MSASLRNSTPVRPEPVEGLLSTSLSWKGQGFDKLSPNGNGNVAEARPFGWRLVREPGILALRISACRLLPRSDGFLAGKSADQERADLAHADASHDGEIGIELSGEQRSNLLDRTALEHVGEAFVTPAVKPLSWWKQGQRAKACYLRAKTRLSPAECAWVESALERLAATTDVPDEFVHNDLHRHNLMILDDQLEAVIDWGSAGFGDPALNYHCLPMDWLPLLLPPDADANFVGRCLDYMLGYALNDIHRQARGGPNSHTGHLRWQALLRFTNLGLRDDWRYWLQDAPVN